MYSVYNRSIPISFQNSLYCGTESKQNDITEIKQTPENQFFIVLLLLLLISLS